MSREGAVMFGARLVFAVVAVLVIAGLVGYLVISRESARSQISTYAEQQRADAASFAAIGSRTTNHQEALAEITEVLNVIARRPGTLETLLIDSSNVVRASGDHAVVGTRDSDPRIDAALTSGTSYAGREADATRDQGDFEFVSPLKLFGERYAYEVSYDDAAFASQLADLRRILIIVGLAVILFGGGLFYLLGGRSLMRDHRKALARATRDGLTDLPNQRAFQDDLPQAVMAALRQQAPLTLLLLDVDDFKFINDRHGHPHGDAVLNRVANVMRDGRPGDRAYRIGGDEFAAILTHTHAEGASVLTRRLQRALDEAGVEVSIGTSTLRPGQSADVLQAEADAALYEAKRQGRHRSVQFDEIRTDVIVISAAKRDAVRRLIDSGSLTMAFQPIWDWETDTLLGLEALMRPDPALGLAGPDEAFDIAEQIGRVHELDELCVANALSFAAALPPDVLLFLNICPQTLDLDANGNNWLRIAVERSGRPVEQIVIEVTERFSGRLASVGKCLEQLRRQGFRIALDDVGTGNSGLELLRRVNVEYVKIDGSIIASAVTEPGARAVLMAMAMFARQTGAFVIAEGIEDEETFQFLRAIDGPDIQAGKVIQGGQGFTLGYPMTDAAALALTTAGIPLVSLTAS